MKSSVLCDLIVFATLMGVIIFGGFSFLVMNAAINRLKAENAMLKRINANLVKIVEEK